MYNPTDILKTLEALNRLSILNMQGELTHAQLSAKYTLQAQLKAYTAHYNDEHIPSGIAWGIDYPAIIEQSQIGREKLAYYNIGKNIK